MKSLRWKNKTLKDNNRDFPGSPMVILLLLWAGFNAWSGN